VGPCDETGVTDISTLDHDFSGCGANPVKFYLVEFDTNYFSDMTLSEAGVLTWTTGLTSVAGKFGSFVFKAVCGNLSAFQEGLICVKDLCLNVTCPPGQECNVCDGECEASVSDINVSKSAKGAVLIGSADLQVSKTSEEA